MKLIDNWRNGWRMFSVQAQVTAAALLGGWQSLTDEMRQVIPGWAVISIAIALLVFGVVGRLVKQERVHRKSGDPK